MRNTTQLLSLTLVICTIVFGACQKSDIPIQSETDSVTDKFFKLPENGLPEVKNIATAIKKQNAAKPFVAGLAKRVGFPNWEKVLVAGNTNGSLARLSSGSEGYAVYIPFVRDSQSFVNSALVVTIKNSDTTYKMLYANRYASYGFDSTKKTGWNAWDVFNCFSLLNNLVFGHTKFLIKDSRLFAPVKPAKHVVLTMIKKSTDGTPNGKTAMYVDVCTTYERCDRYESEPTPPSNVIRTTSLAGCLETSTWVECTTYYINDSGGGGGTTGTDPGTGGDPSGGGGGTGGNDGGWADDPCTGGSTPSVQRTTNVLPCDEPIGWEPIDEENVEPPFVWSFTGDDGSVFSDPDPSKEPEFVFDPADGYETKYPRFTAMVKNLKSFVKNNPKVMNALQKNTGFSKQEILEHLTFGKGPTIKVIDQDMLGEYSPYFKQLKIKASWVRGLEVAQLESTQEATAFLLGVTVLHEYAHYGSYQSGLIYSLGRYEFGTGFELQAFDVIVNSKNAADIVVKFKEYF